MQHVCTGQPPHHLWCAICASHQHESCRSLLHVFTWSFIKRQAREPDIENACVTGTFDQPPWLKAVEIRVSNSLTVVCRLVGFHVLMSYLDSIDTVMSGSGFSDPLDMCYGLNAVIHMIPFPSLERATML